MAILRGSHKGQAVVMVALALVVLMGSLGLAIEGGRAYAERRAMQNAADAGALAGARALAQGQGPSTATSTATQYARRNGADRDVDVTVQGNTVTVVAHKSFSTVFAGFVGWPVLSVSARAEAGYSPVGGKEDLFPTVIKEFDFVYGDVYTIWDDDKEVQDPGATHVIVGGNRGWANFNGGSVGDSELKLWVREGYPGRIDVGDWVNGEPGTSSAAVNESHCRLGQTIFVAMYDTMRAGQMGSGQVDYHVVSIAAFQVVDVQWPGTPKGIVGRFVPYVTSGEPGGGPVDTGVITVSLIN